MPNSCCCSLCWCQNKKDNENNKVIKSRTRVNQIAPMPIKPRDPKADRNDGVVVAKYTDQAGITALQQRSKEIAEDRITTEPTPPSRISTAIPSESKRTEEGFRSPINRKIMIVPPSTLRDVEPKFTSENAVSTKIATASKKSLLLEALPSVEQPINLHLGQAGTTPSQGRGNLPAPSPYSVTIVRQTPSSSFTAAASGSPTFAVSSTPSPAGAITGPNSTSSNKTTVSLGAAAAPHRQIPVQRTFTFMPSTDNPPSPPHTKLKRS